VQAKTPRALSRAGAVAVLGLGLLLLPLLPVAGQDQDPPPAVEPAADRDATDKKIERLKKALRLLEEEQATEKGAGTLQRRYRVILQTRDVGVLTQAAADLEQAEKDVAQKRHDLKAAEDRLARARDRVAEMKKELPPAGLPVVIPAPAQPTLSPRPVRVEVTQRVDRLTELEQKLDRVMREIDALRKDLQKERHPTPPMRPVPPPALPPTSATPPAPPTPPIPDLDVRPSPRDN
jgi:hypothetical protein